MKRFSGILIAFLAISIVSAFSLVDEAYAAAPSAVVITSLDLNSDPGILTLTFNTSIDSILDVDVTTVLIGIADDDTFASAYRLTTSADDDATH